MRKKTGDTYPGYVSPTHLLEDEADGHGERHRPGTAVDHERLIDPLPHGRDGGLVEERDGLQDPDGGDAPVDVGRRSEDDDALDPGLLCDAWVVRLDAADELGRFDLADRLDRWRLDVANETVEIVAKKVGRQPALQPVVDAAVDAEIGPFGPKNTLFDDANGDGFRGYPPGLGRRRDGPLLGDAGAGIAGPRLGRRQRRRRQGRDHDDARDVDLRQLPYPEERHGHEQRQRDRVDERGQRQSRGPVPQMSFRDEQRVLEHLGLLAADSRKLALP